MSEVDLLRKGDGGMVPDKPWWKTQENEKSFPAPHKEAGFCDMSLINVYMNAIFVYI